MFNVFSVLGCGFYVLRVFVCVRMLFCVTRTGGRTQNEGVTPNLNIVGHLCFCYAQCIHTCWPSCTPLPMDGLLAVMNQPLNSVVATTHGWHLWPHMAWLVLLQMVRTMPAPCAHTT